MAKKKTSRGTSAAPTALAQEQQATLKDLLNPDVLQRLKSQAAEWKDEEQKKQEQAKRAAEEARIAERKRLESNFEHLLNNSEMDWRKYK